MHAYIYTCMHTCTRTQTCTKKQEVTLLWFSFSLQIGQQNCTERVHSAFFVLFCFFKHSTAWSGVCVCAVSLSLLMSQGSVHSCMTSMSFNLCHKCVKPQSRWILRLVRGCWVILHNSSYSALMMRLHTQVIKSSLAEPVPEGYENVSDIVPPYNAFSTQGQPEVMIHTRQVRSHIMGTGGYVALLPMCHKTYSQNIVHLSSCYWNILANKCNASKKCPKI